MQKFHSKNLAFLNCLICAWLVIYGHKQLMAYSVPANYLSPLHMLPFTKSLNPDNKTNAIWNRVRLNFKIMLPSPTHFPLFERHIKLAKSQNHINALVKNATPYFFYILEEVEKRGMPSEIALLPMIESLYNPHDLSHKGAVGLWQIMPALGKLHGLKQDPWYDGRKDIYESTKVALDHLQHLQKRFNGNWLLALAAYNCGEYKVLNAIKKNKAANKATDFWSLQLPKETTHFVPKLLALAAIIQSPQQFGVTLPPIANQPVFTRIHTGRAIDIAHAAKLVDISESQLHKLNPGFHQKAMHPQGPFNLVVPIQYAEGLCKKINTLPPLNT